MSPCDTPAPSYSEKAQWLGLKVIQDISARYIFILWHPGIATLTHFWHPFPLKAKFSVQLIRPANSIFAFTKEETKYNWAAISQGFSVVYPTFHKFWDLILQAKHSCKFSCVTIPGWYPSLLHFSKFFTAREQLRVKGLVIEGEKFSRNKN